MTTQDIRECPTDPAPAPSPFEDYCNALENLARTTRQLTTAVNATERDRLIDRAAQALTTMQCLKEFI